MSTAFDQYAVGIRELHKLIAAGKCDTDEADVVRDRLDPLWRAMSEEEHDAASALSESLYAEAEAA